eukprot:g4688.t1
MLLSRRICQFSTSIKNTLSLNKLAEQFPLVGRHVLVRVDFNVPMNKETSLINDDTRIRAALPTIQFLQKEGAKVVLCSHMGRPKKKVVENLRLSPVGKRLEELLGNSVSVLDDCVGESVRTAVSEMQNGNVTLLENVRFYAGEEENDSEFSRALVHSSCASIYVNDAFGTSHRAHASTEGVTKQPAIVASAAGFLMNKELEYLVAAMDPDRAKMPIAAVVGGSKVSTKLPILASLMETCDTILLGGGMIFTFYKAMGTAVGNSLVEEDQIEQALSIMEKAKECGVNLVLPSDVVVASEFSADASSKVINMDAKSAGVPDGWMGLDIGPSTLSHFKSSLENMGTIIWNGPMGVFEFPRFAQGTVALAETIAECTDRGAVSVIGGGDSVSAVSSAGLNERMSHISTGGGASLELLEGKILPGIAALERA